MNKQDLYSDRKNFFEEVVRHINIPPTKIDSVLNQARYYVQPDASGTYMNVELGDLIIPVKGEFFGTKFNILYTMWQVGSFLRIGLSVKEVEILGAFQDEQGEIERLWTGQFDTRSIDTHYGFVLYDWSFDVPYLYDNYKNMEQFILGMRHMHFRIMKMIHAECQRLQQQ